MMNYYSNMPFYEREEECFALALGLRADLILA